MSMSDYYTKIEKLEKTLDELRQNLIVMEARLSRLANPDYPHYTEEEINAMTEWAKNEGNRFV